MIKNYIVKSYTEIEENTIENNIDYSVFKFSAGELNVTLDVKLPVNVKMIRISGSILSSDNLMELLLLKNALDNFYETNKIILDLFYTAYSRQDRIMQTGDSFSLKVFTNLINLMNFTKVFMYDNHSDVSTALIERGHNLSPIIIAGRTIGEHIEKHEIQYIVSPDAGSNKKSFELSKYYQIPMIRADKRRDLSGQIVETILFADDLENKNVIITDDICDGGRTFIELSKALKLANSGEITLYVTHGIFSQGLDVIFENIDYVITTTSFEKKHDEEELEKYKDRLTIIKL